MFSVILLVRLDEFKPMWSMMSVSCGWRSAMWANRGTSPTAMTASPAFSAAGQNQSAVPSESQASAAVRVALRLGADLSDAAGQQLNARRLSSQCGEIRCSLTLH
jgi:hypothetical protein